MTIHRHLRVHVRAGANLTTDSGGTYVVLKLNELRERTKPAKGEYPVWNENIVYGLPDASPDEKPPVLYVKVRLHNYLRMDRTIGKGSLTLPVAYGPGLTESKIPLTDEDGTAAGVVYLGIEILAGRVGEAQGPPTPPPGGFLVGMIPPPRGGAELPSGGKEELLPSATETPITPVTGPLAPGNIADPSQPTYGVL